MIFYILFIKIYALILMEYLLLSLIIITILIITNETEIKEYFTTFGIINSYTNIDDAVQGIALDDSYFYPININSISKYDILSGNKIKQINLSSHSRIYKLHDGTSVGNKLFICNQTKNNKNTIEVFNKNLEFEYYINVTGDNGVLTWIEYFQEKWWGCFSHYNLDTKYTVIVEFYTSISAIGADSLITRDKNTQELDVDAPEPGWHIRNRWFLPAKVYNNITPNSITGGSFDSKGNLYLTTSLKKQIFIMGFHPSSPMLNLNYIKNVEFKGQGISWNRKNNILVGINPDTKSVYFYSNNYELDKPSCSLSGQKPSPTPSPTPIPTQSIGDKKNINGYLVVGLIILAIVVTSFFVFTL